jgi:hypothetical protein
MGHLREVAGALGLLVMLGATRYPHWGGEEPVYLEQILFLGKKLTDGGIQFLGVSANVSATGLRVSVDHLAASPSTAPTTFGPGQ